MTVTARLSRFFGAALCTALVACSADPAPAPSAVDPTPAVSTAPLDGEFLYDVDQVTGHFEAIAMECEPATATGSHQLTSCAAANESFAVSADLLHTDDAIAALTLRIAAVEAEETLHSAALPFLSEAYLWSMSESAAAGAAAWLAEHLGDEYAETVLGGLHVSTMVSPDGELLTRVANAGYMDQLADD